MTTSHRILFWIFLPVLFFLAAFQSVSPGSASTPAGTATASPTPTRVPSPTPNLPPAGASAYRLKSWTETDAESAMAILKDEEKKNDELENRASYDISLYHSKDFNSTAMTLLEESLLRFPGSAEREPWNKQLLNRKLRDYEDQESLKMLISRMEEALNSDPGLTSNLSEWLEKNYPDITLASNQTVNNLFSSGNQDLLIGLDNSYTFSSGLIGIQKDVTGKFHAYPVIDTWRPTFYDSWKMTTDDLNGDGIPDVAIQHDYFTTGYSHWCDQSIDIYEWNGQQFTDLALNLGSLSTSTDFGNCGGWEYQPGDKGTKILIGKLIQGGEDETPDSFVRKIRYIWKGTRFEWAGEETLPLANLDDLTAAANWAFEAGSQNEQAFSILKKNVQAWPPEFEKDWGPAAQDYFRFKLGFWYALRGDTQNAVNTLTQVRDHPDHPEYKTVSRMAAAFLQGYLSHGNFAGCSAVIHTLWAEYQSFKDYSLYDLNDPDKMLPTWGFYNQPWIRDDNTFWPVEERGQETGICSLSEAFQISLARASIHNQDELISWLTFNQVPFKGLQAADLNGDDLTDWLVTLNTAEPSFRDLWALIQGPSGIKAIKIDNFLAKSNSITAYRAFQPAKEAGTFHAYQVKQVVSVFHIQKSGEKVSAMVDFTFYTKGQGLAIDVRGQAPEQQLVVHEDSGDDRIIAWDVDRQQLTKTYASPTQAGRITEAENALFKEQNPLHAQKIILALFREGIHEEVPINWLNGEFAPLNRSYLQYLLGLTYELTGNQANAVQAYYQLWHDDPYNPYAVIAREKLERKP